MRFIAYCHTRYLSVKRGRETYHRVCCLIIRRCLSVIRVIVSKIINKHKYTLLGFPTPFNAVQRYCILYTLVKCFAVFFQKKKRKNEKNTKQTKIILEYYIIIPQISHFKPHLSDFLLEVILLFHPIVKVG